MREWPRMEPYVDPEYARLTAELAGLRRREQALREAGAVLVGYVEHQPFSLARMTAIEAWRAALAAAGGSV